MPPTSPKKEQLPKKKERKKERHKRVCEECGKQGKGRGSEALLCCGACKESFYCNAQCQKEAWPTHKPVCSDRVRNHVIKQAQQCEAVSVHTGKFFRFFRTRELDTGRVFMQTMFTATTPLKLEEQCWCGSIASQRQEPRVRATSACHLFTVPLRVLTRLRHQPVSPVTCCGSLYDAYSAEFTLLTSENKKQDCALWFSRSGDDSLEVRLSEKTTQPLNSLHGDLFLFSLFILHSTDLSRPHLMPAYDPCEDLTKPELLSNMSCGVSRQALYGTGGQIPLSRVRFADLLAGALPRLELAALLRDPRASAHLHGAQYVNNRRKHKKHHSGAQKQQLVHEVATEEKQEKEKQEKEEEKQEEKEEKKQEQQQHDSQTVDDAQTLLQTVREPGPDAVVTLLLVSECLKPLRTGADLESEFLASGIHQYHIADSPDERVPLFANALALSVGLKELLPKATVVPINPAIKC